MNWDNMAYRHPSLLVTPDGGEEESPICFECGEGWVGLLEELWDRIETFLKENPQDERVYVTCVKEKFGRLRVYMNRFVPEIQDMIIAAEQVSSEVCEICGASGTIVNVAEHGGTYWGCRCQTHSPNNS